ncbi:hypothetical protein [Aestuariibius sp. HNIBRBA575]|uniref:hypothetical protein n=1 Tax=Aestuariibius sp. HNIBRBA575 TaxID=3233343 RepID=UPI0034A2E7DC
MVRNLILVLSTVGLSGCSLNEVKPAVECSANCNLPHSSNSEAIRVDGIEIGMTREQVLGVLGDDFVSHTPLSMQPLIDSFRYVDENGATKWIWVHYSDGLVVKADDDHDEVYRIDFRPTPPSLTEGNAEVDGFAGCTLNDTETRTECDGGCDLRTMSASQRIQVDGIEDGMTRDQVAAVLGDQYFDHIPPGFRPSIDSFPYVDENGQTKFIWIRYRQGRVIEAVDNRDERYIVD